MSHVLLIIATVVLGFLVQRAYAVHKIVSGSPCPVLISLFHHL